MTSLPDSELLAAVARGASERAGRLLRERFRTPTDADYGTDDVTTAVDRAAERLIRDRIGEQFPGHAIAGEELGRTSGGPIEWLVDPLDGTNNYAIGHPTVAVAVSARVDDRPLAAAIHEPLLGETLLAADDCGTDRITGTARPTAVGSDSPLDENDEEWFDESEPFADGDRLRPTYDRPLARSTVSFVVGVAVVRDDQRRATAERVEKRLRDCAKRTLQTWAPCVDWGHLVRGDTAAIVCFAPDDREQVPGELLAREAGVDVEWHGDWVLAAHTPEARRRIRAQLPDAVTDRP